MKLFGMTLLALMSVSAGSCVLGQPCFAQDASSATGRSGQSEATLAPGTAIFAELNSGMDSKKAKVGDTISARTTEAMKSTDDRTIMPRGTKIEGHITQAAARGKGGEESSLGIQFDKAVLKDGAEIPLNVVIQALAAPAMQGPLDSGPTPSPENTGTAQTSPMGGGHMGPPSAQAPPSSGRMPDSGPTSSSQLDARSRGAIGMHGITLNSEPANNRPATIVASNGKSVRLDSGTRMLLVVQGEAPASTPGR